MKKLKIRYLMDKGRKCPQTILTETEKEALILENNLIKEHGPKYNVNLRDDKSFFFTAECLTSIPETELGPTKK